MNIKAVDRQAESVPLSINKQGFVYDPEGKIWLPPINAKQLEIFNDYHRYLLVHGPRKSGKTFGILHKVLRHAFDVRGAMFAIVTKTIKNAKAAGVWVLLNRMLRIWESGCVGFRITEGPKTTGDSKMSFVRIRNRHGGVSEIQCHSLEQSAEVEAKFKGPAYSGIWLSEVDQYCDENAFDIFCDALRMWPDVSYEEHQLIADCNPPDTGTNNWMHDKWFKHKDAKPTEEDTDGDRELRENLHRILVMIEDNPQLDERERRDLEARYRKRRTLYNRFILGKWEHDIVDGHFSDVWNENIHVVGSADGPEDDWEVMVPTPLCRELLCGWDIGEKKSHSFHIMEKLMTEEPKTHRLIVSFNVLDELVCVRQFISVEEFVIAAVEKMLHWEKWQKEKHEIEILWRHWSDTSAFEQRASANTSDAAIAYAASLGKVALQGAPKYRDSNRDKVKLLWQFLYARRLHVSAQCFKTRSMFAMLRSDPGSASSKYVKRDDHKHPFDSLAYPILAEAPQDMFKTAEIDTTQKESSPRPVFAGF